MNLKLIWAAGLVAVAAAGYAQTSVPLAQLWKVNGGERTYLPASGDTVRGMDYNPVSGNLLINNRAVLSRMDADTGATVEPAVPATGYGGGNFLINKVAVADDGVIYVTNLATAAGSNFRLYRHENEASAPTTAFGAAAAARIGDEIAVTGSGVNTKVLVGGLNVPHLYLFTTVDGVTFTSSTITPSNPETSGMPALAWDPNGVDYWFRNPETVGAQKYSGLTHQGIGPRIGGGEDSGYGPIDVANVGSLQLLGVGIANSSAGNTNKPALFYDTTTNENLFAAIGTGHVDGSKANTNGTGDVAFDVANGRVYFLYTNNAVSAYDLDDASVGEWNLY